MFTGTTNVTDTAWGIQFGDDDDAVNVTGPGGGAVNLGVVHFAGNAPASNPWVGGQPQQHISNDQGNVAIILSASSTIDGRPVTRSDFLDSLSLTIREESVDPDVPGVPNTGFAW